MKDSESKVGTPEQPREPQGSRVFIVWEPHNSRSAGLAREFAAECFYVHYLALKRPWLAPLKYVLQAFRTLAILLRRRPDIVFVQNPPVIAPLVAWFYCRLFHATLIIDSHTGVFLEPKWRRLSALHRFVARRAAVNIVTNEYLAGILQDWGANAFIVADVPMLFHDLEKREAGLGPQVTVVATFSYDEPLDEVLLAARALPEVTFAITGDCTRGDAALFAETPANVRFTGFMSRRMYVNTVSSSAAVIVLTTENHTMQRGAYEAMYMGIPIITSDWPLLRSTFSKGTVHVDNRAGSIRAAVQEILSDHERFTTEVCQLRRQRQQLWAERRESLERLYIADPSARKSPVNVYG